MPPRHRGSTAWPRSSRISREITVVGRGDSRRSGFLSDTAVSTNSGLHRGPCGLRRVAQNPMSAAAPERRAGSTVTAGNSGLRPSAGPGGGAWDWGAGPDDVRPPPQPDVTAMARRQAALPRRVIWHLATPDYATRSRSGKGNAPDKVRRTLRISCEAVPPSVWPAGAQGGTSACHTGAALSFVSCIRLFDGSSLASSRLPNRGLRVSEWVKTEVPGRRRVRQSWPELRLRGRRIRAYFAHASKTAATSPT